MQAGRMAAWAAGIGCLVAWAGFAAAQETPLSVMRAKSKGKCITLEEKMIDFGEETSRKAAFAKLDSSIAILHKARPRYASAKEKHRDAKCVTYLKTLNEFECTAEATLCR
jgi:hypothetical protein